jgi:type I restriction enzyme S subunit
MIDGLKPYPEYKDSGVPWLGEVPAHWELRKTKYLFQERSEKGFPTEPLLAATQTKGVVRKEEYENRTVLALKDLHLLKLVRVGDFVISLRSFQGGIEFARHQGIISPAYTILYSIDPAHQPFFAVLFKSKPYIDNLSLFVTGIRQGQNIDYKRLSNSVLPVPSPEEQRAIARFLAHHDRLTRRYIRAQRRLIELLTKQKQALIQQAVTRGLDPHVKLKPSGIEWLGEIPEHWEIVRIKYLLREVDERSTTGQETLLSLRMNHGLVPHDEHFARPGQASTLVGYKLVRPGQVVLNKLQANNGLVFASEVFGLVSPDYAVFSPIADVDLHYLTALFRTIMMKHKFRVESKGLGTGTSGFLRLYTDRFGAIPVSLPPRDEQSQIMRDLNVLLKGFQDAIARAQRRIDLIREYRTRLIADVVTGKLDVRGVSLPDLEETSDLGDLDDLEEDAERDDLDAEELDDADD